MWIFMNDAMLSVVRHKDKPEHLMVRARVQGHIERVFPNVRENYTPLADYGYRAVIHQDEVAKVMASKVEGIDYPNFKSSVKDRGLHDAYYGVWDCMYREQNRRWELVEEEL